MQGGLFCNKLRVTTYDPVTQVLGCVTLGRLKHDTWLPMPVEVA